MTVPSGNITGIPTIGTPPPPNLVNPRQNQNPNQAQSRLLSFLEKATLYAASVWGLPADYAKPLNVDPTAPRNATDARGSTDVPPGRMNGRAPARLQVSAIPQRVP